MSKYHIFKTHLQQLEHLGWIEIKGDEMTILSHGEEVKNRLMQTQWGALLLMGALPDAGVE